MAVGLKRVYEAPSAPDGIRVLVDRLWPRGLSKESARVDHWLKDLAPSDDLRKWYHARPSQWLAFRKKYIEELSEPVAEAALELLHALARGRKRLTLLYASKNTERNNAVVLKELLEGMRKPPSSSGPAKAVAGASRVRMRAK